MAIVHPIAQAWISTGGTGAQNYDEFASDDEITRIIEANPHSALAVEMPHRAPESLDTDFAGALPAAVQRLADAKLAGRYLPAQQTVVLYRITGDRDTAYGMFAMVDTAQISTSADEPGLVIRNEDVFAAKVRERVALAHATGHLLSPVLLLQSARGDDLHRALQAAVAVAGPAAAVDNDHQGRTHEIWPLPDGPTAARLCDLAGGGELVVADGNHRTLAAQTGGLRRFLAVITTPGSVSIQPYNRLLTDLPAGLLTDPPTGLPAGTPESLDLAPVPDTPDLPPPPGVAYLYRAGGSVPGPDRTGGFTRITLPVDPDAPLVDRLDHSLIEKLLVRQLLGLDPDDKRIGYIGGDYPAPWLCGEVDAGRAAAAVLIAPVSTTDFIAVNLARQKMPRKSTWFTPKARAGLVLAQLD
jgi:uncharacterized protein (DUF1015 family)